MCLIEIAIYHVDCDNVPRGYVHEHMVVVFYSEVYNKWLFPRHLFSWSKSSANLWIWKWLIKLQCLINNFILGIFHVNWWWRVLEPEMPETLETTRMNYRVIGANCDLKRKLLVVLLWLMKHSDQKGVVYGYLVSILSWTKMSAFWFVYDALIILTHLSWMMVRYNHCNLINHL